MSDQDKKDKKKSGYYKEEIDTRTLRPLEEVNMEMFSKMRGFGNGHKNKKVIPKKDD